MIDYYKILGVPRIATELQIKEAYRKLALELHPDKNSSPNTHDQLIKLTEAFEVLKSMKTRNIEFLEDKLVKKILSPFSSESY